VAPFRGFVRNVLRLVRRQKLVVLRQSAFPLDFLYQVEWQRALKHGELHRLDLAFSRDPECKSLATIRTSPYGLLNKKHYVQHDMLRQA